MEFKLPLLAVKNIEISKNFYEEVFAQKVVLDLGKNVTFNGGFAIQEDFAWLLDIPSSTVKEKSHNMELYFETNDFDSFIERLNHYKNIEYVHPPIKHEWQQRVVRIYDPDHHIIEIGESMVSISEKYAKEGKSIEEIAKLIHFPVEEVKRMLDLKL